MSAAARFGVSQPGGVTRRLAVAAQVDGVRGKALPPRATPSPSAGGRAPADRNRAGCSTSGRARAAPRPSALAGRRAQTAIGMAVGLHGESLRRRQGRGRLRALTGQTDVQAGSDRRAPSRRAGGAKARRYLWIKPRRLASRSVGAEDTSACAQMTRSSKVVTMSNAAASGCGALPGRTLSATCHAGRAGGAPAPRVTSETKSTAAGGTSIAAAIRA